MKSLVRWLDARLYPDFQHRWDDQLFRERILAHLGDGDLDVLDLGAGAGIVEAMDFGGRARRVCGVDPDPRVVDKPYLYEGRAGDDVFPTRYRANSPADIRRLAAGGSKWCAWS